MIRAPALIGSSPGIVRSSKRTSALRPNPIRLHLRAMRYPRGRRIPAEGEEGEQLSEAAVAADQAAGSRTGRVHRIAENGRACVAF